MGVGGVGVGGVGVCGVGVCGVGVGGVGEGSHHISYCLSFPSWLQGNPQSEVSLL